MNPADRERVKDLLARAASLSPDERLGFIESANAGQEVICEALDLLPTLDDSAFFSAPTGAGYLSKSSPSIPGEQPGTRVGRYKLLQSIGEGGFGTVFMAEQVEPVHRRVALKIIKAGMDTKQVIARFEAERQALALMDHPNIARVFDAGATDQGRPFFVMELVRGEPITKYCDHARLSVPQRLQLFRSVCNAVEHAHQKGIIHRDLKPSNVLVTVADGEPLPKVIDFGIAKATATRLTDKTMFTEMHQLIGTPEYMSPEQAEVTGVDVDTRSDIYSLGVLLYELLTASTPLERSRFQSTPLAEIRRLIREEEAPRPSLRLAARRSSGAQGWPLPEAQLGGAGSSAHDIAERRRSEPIQLTRIVRGDLDWIVMKCLEKDRSRRYPTASALADDVRRYLTEQPVSAAPPSSRDRFSKFVRRNRRAVFAGTAVAATLLLASAVSIAFALSATRQRAAAVIARERAESAESEAKLRAEELEKVAGFQEAQLSGINPQTMGVRLRSGLLRNAKTAAEHAAVPQEEIQRRADALESLIAGTDFTHMALEVLEENFFQPAFQAVERQFADQPLVKARLLQSSADAMHELGLVESALKPQEECLAIRRELLGDAHPATLESIGKLGFLCESLGRLDDAERFLQEALTAGQKYLKDDDPELLEWTNNMGLVLQARGDLVNAERFYRDAMEKRRKSLGPDHADAIGSLNNMGYFLQAKGRLAEAERYLREALEKYRRIHGNEHRATLMALNNMGAMSFAQGKLSEAEAYFREAVETSRRVLGGDHHDTLLALDNLSVVLRSLGRVAESEIACREAFEKYRRVLGDDHIDTIIAKGNLGVLLGSVQRTSEGEELLRSALEASRRVLGDDNPITLRTVFNLAALLRNTERDFEAEPLLRETVAGRKKVLGNDHPDTLTAISNLGALLTAHHKDAEALVLLVPAEDAAREAFVGGNAFYLGRFLVALGRARLGDRDFGTARVNLTEAFDIFKVSKGTANQDRSDVLDSLIELFETWHTAEPDDGYDAIASQ